MEEEHMCLPAAGALISSLRTKAKRQMDQTHIAMSFYHPSYCFPSRHPSALETQSSTCQQVESRQWRECPAGTVERCITKAAAVTQEQIYYLWNRNGRIR
ncbi:unnamed protein product [Boreogadus saida]